MVFPHLFFGYPSTYCALSDHLISPSNISKVQLADGPFPWAQQLSVTQILGQTPEETVKIDTWLPLGK